MHKPALDETDERIRIVASLFTAGQGSIRPVDDSEFGSLLNHQMRASVVAVLSEETNEPRATLDEIARELAGLGIRTFADLFDHPTPPAAALDAVRRYTKRLLKGEPESLPLDVARVLYVVTELCASTPNAVAHGLASTANLSHLGRWCLAQTWLDERTRRLVRRGLTPSRR